MYRENFTLPNNTAADELGEFLSQDAREEAEGLFQEAQALGEETQVNVTIGSKPRQSIAAPFVLAFSSNLRLLADLGLSSSETRLLAYVIETMEFGNLLNFSQARAGKDLNYSKAHTSRLESPRV